MTYHDLKEYKEAKKCFEKAIKIDKENVGAWKGLGMTYHDLKEYKEAKKCFERVTKLDENNADAWEGLGISYIKLKNYEEAKKCFEKAIKLDPKDEGINASLIELLIIKGNYGEAFEKARANMDLFKSDKYRALALFFAAVSLALQNKHEESMEWMNKLLQHLEKAEKPYSVSWDFSDIKPTLEQHLKKEDMALISRLIEVKEEADFVELELKVKRG